MRVRLLQSPIGECATDSRASQSSAAGLHTPGALRSDDISGNVSVTDVHFNQVFIGDGRGEPFFSNGESCGGNTIHGSVLMRNVDFVRFDGEPSEIEANTVTGSVQIDHTLLR